MVYAPHGTKAELRKASRQVATVIDLNKCLGCQLCVVACKNLWTKRPGTEHMRWMNVTTHPGAGHPRNYEQKGGGFKRGEPQPGTLTNMSDCGDHFQFNQKEVMFGGKGQSVHIHPVNSKGEKPEWGYNWDEDVGAGSWPNPYFFYFPRKCNQCSNPACLSACPRNAIYKREQDGVVVIDQDRCEGHRHCLEACPYKAINFNPVSQKSEKCIECYPRLEKKIANACNRMCTGRTRAFGYLDDEDGQVFKLVKQWQVALPLHPEAGTVPNVYYVPPLGSRGFEEDGSITDQTRIPAEELERLFGPRVHEALKTIRRERQKVRDGQHSELIDILISRVWKDRFGGFTNEPLEQHTT
jgi:DMSO reductase family type II enzyme iron-sulfur subunit